MISIVMPYWNRQDALQRNLDSYCDLYSSDDIEIVVVDDGSPEPAKTHGPFPWPVKVIHLPRKDSALDPCVPYNLGVAASRGEVLVLTNPEVVHRFPILGRMREVLAEMGPKGYVSAACWGLGDRGSRWFCHSKLMPPAESMGRAPTPPMAGFHFCSMIHRSFYDEIGGFSEEYREGQAYEDNDLLWKLYDAGAKFRICDDLVTDHYECPRCRWPAGGHERNRAIFVKKWPRLQN